jgi:hypothetical protein
VQGQWPSAAGSLGGRGAPARRAKFDHELEEPCPFPGELLILMCLSQSSYFCDIVPASAAVC